MQYKLLLMHPLVKNRELSQQLLLQIASQLILLVLQINFSYLVKPISLYILPSESKA